MYIVIIPDRVVVWLTPNQFNQIKQSINQNGINDRKQFYQTHQKLGLGIFVKTS